MQKEKAGPAPELAAKSGAKLRMILISVLIVTFMYGATGNLIHKGWIREVESHDPADRRKRLYALTEAGRNALEDEIGRLHRLIDGADEVLGQGGSNER